MLPGGPELEITVSKKWDDQRATNASVAWLAGSVVGKTTHVHAGHRVDVPVVWFGGSPWGAVLGALETSEDAEDAAAAAAATARAMDVAWASLAAVSFPLDAAAVYVGIVRPVRCLWATWSGAAQRGKFADAHFGDGTQRRKGAKGKFVALIFWNHEGAKAQRRKRAVSADDEPGCGWYTWKHEPLDPCHFR